MKILFQYTTTKSQQWPFSDCIALHFFWLRYKSQPKLYTRCCKAESGNSIKLFFITFIRHFLCG